jgi:chemotaxis protein histidine kinase CheA
LDKAAFRSMFLQVDAPIADSLASAIAELGEASSPELRETAGLLCHRLRGDARTVGFNLMGELAWEMERTLRSSPGSPLDGASLSFLRAAATELRRRMQAGETACDEPLPERLLSLA